MQVHETNASDRARKIFRGKSEPLPTFDELISLGSALQGENQLDDARRLFEMALFGCSSGVDPETKTNVLRKLILCTYKDPDLPAEVRLQTAEHMLSAVLGKPLDENAEPTSPIIVDLAATLDRFPKLKQDLLGIAGAVQKRRWDIYGQRVHLVSSYQYYRRGYEMGCQNDRAYNAINLAFVLDLLSDQEEGELDHGLAARTMAARVRTEIVATLDPIHTVETQETFQKLSDPDLMNDWWVLLTLAEAWLGLKDYAKAAYWMAAAADLRAKLELDPDQQKHIAPWQFESAVRQFAQLARICARRDGILPANLETSAAWGALKALLKDNGEEAASFLRGKIGLALSGGGFRASLFHIGLLAKLAEFDVLRHVEVLSCVSGGSILGAYYYLELRKMLQEHTDAEITRQHYVELVQSIYRNFLAGVQRNIRLRMLFGWPSNAKIFSAKGSSSSDRLADLYEQELYARVKDGKQGQPRYLADLRVTPIVETTAKDGTVQRARASHFNPKYDNWKRHNKVPALVLNATSLNSCHNWQFTASFMGEPPPRGIDVEIDANHRLRRMYHGEAPGTYRRDAGKPNQSGGVRLGEAVAASACVPGLFDPILLDDLYGALGRTAEKYRARLVDGGNYDNQGVASLREQDCTVLIISDACGQTGMSPEPASGHVGVMIRANDILMSRVRELQYQLLSNLKDAHTLQGVMYVHLKKGLEAQTVDWVCCDDPSTYKAPPAKTNYGIREDVQRLLASVRTDLDSFSWLESNALMVSAYRMTEVEWRKCLPFLTPSNAPPAAWEFLRLDSTMTADDGTPAAEGVPQLKKGLRIASKLAFKPFELYPVLKAAGIAILLAIAALWIWATVNHWTALAPVVKVFCFSVVGIILLVLVKEVFLGRILRYRNSYLDVFIACVMCLFGWIVFYPYLYVIDPLYIKWGSNK